ncbi:MAG: glycosyltransferase [Clostridia bacterium]|nr:glycosyltransferase [Clostridia bacterium]
MKKILIVSHTMELGGAERALLGLLNNIDYENYSVDLFLERHFGELLPFLPEKVNLLPENASYASLGVPASQVVKNKKFLVAAGRYIGKKKSEKFNRAAGSAGGVDVTINYSYKYTCPFMPKISKTEYDLVISFLTPHYFAAKKAKGKMKVAWIHTDYKAIKIDRKSEEKMWRNFDKIISISQEVTNNFAEVFPGLKDRIIEINNMHPAGFIRAESEKFTPDDEMPQSCLRLLSIGRYCVAKNFDNVPFICKELVEKYGIDLKWYIIGYGTDEALIVSKIKEAGMEDRVILLGKKDNPYPYVKQCDFYVQPSRFEGNAVTVNEALILGKKVIVTDYDTAKNQVENGVDGVIVPLENSLCAEGIAAYIRDEKKQEEISNTVSQNDYSNSTEINKIYELMR